MYEMLQVTFDSADVPAMERFWTAAFGDVREPPPPGFASWEEFLETNQAQRGEEFDEMGSHWVVMSDVEGNELCVS